MNGFELMIVFLPTIVLGILGYLIRYRKAYWLISGYNLMSAEKKKRVDTEGLGDLMGTMCFLMGGILLVGLLLLQFDQTAAGFGVLAILVPVIIYTLITAQQYDGNTRTASGQMKPGAKVFLGVLIVFLLALMGFASYMVVEGMQPIAIEIANNTLQIAGSYGKHIPLTEIKTVRLQNDRPAIELRTNGSAVGSVLRGHFRLAEIGPALLFLDLNQPPFIVLETDDQTVFINAETPQATRQLFDELETSLDS